MEATLFYNYKLIGDVLLVNLDSELLPNHFEKHDDVTLIYSNSKLVGINIFNISNVLKLKTEGRIILPPNSLIDIINDKCASLGIDKIDYVSSSGFKVGKIISCEEHPESNHLHCLKVDIGNEVLDIVCGAKNVKVGLNVVVATIGTTLMDGSVIKKGQLLGEESYGMCCSPKELGLNIPYPPHHLLELDDDVTLGQDFFSIEGKQI